jgi:steroid delta-isomerase-like uncharacterized protein
MSPEEKNTALIHRWFDEVWNQGRLETIDELASPTVIARGQLEHGQPIQGTAHFKTFTQAIRTAFPDIVVTIEDTIAEGDKVVARWISTMTHHGEFLGLAPTGKKVTISGISVQKIANGRIIEGWDNWDQLALLVQLGAMNRVSFMAA